MTIWRKWGGYGGFSKHSAVIVSIENIMIGFGSRVVDTHGADFDVGVWSRKASGCGSLLQSWQVLTKRRSS